MSDVQIILVEDDVIEAMDLKRRLESFGYSVPYVASRGEEAVNKIFELMPDLVLMDIILKGEMNGIEVASKINKLNIPVIYLTAHSDEVTLKKANLTEPYAYLIKPYDVIELKLSIEIALYKSKQEKKLKESEKRYRMLFENSQVTTAITSMEGKVITANEKFFEMVGAKPEDVHSIDLKSMYQNIRQRETIIETLKRGGKVREFEVDLVGKDGRPYKNSINVDLISYQGEDAMLVTAIDITDRKMVEDELRIAGLYNRSLIEASLDPLITIGVDGKVTDVNRATELVTGCSRDDLIGSDFSDYFTDPVRARDGFEKVFEKGWVRDYPLDIRGKNGQVTPVLYNASVYRDDSGEVVGVFAAARDITELKMIEKTLKDSEERMRLTLEATHIGLWDWDVTNDQWYASPTYYSMLGYDPQNGLADREEWLERVHPDDRDRVKEKIESVLIQNFDSYEYEARMLHADGTYRWIAVFGISIQRDMDGNVTRMLGIRRDIHNRKKAEKAIIQAKEEWEKTFDAVPDLIAILDVNFSIIRANKALADRLGVSTEEAIGITCYDAVHGLNAPPSFCPHRKLLEDSQEHTVEIHEDIIGGDFIVSVSPLYDSEGKLMGSVHVARDITDRKRAEDKLKESLKEKEVLLSEIHHRVKNNMQIISSLLNLQTQYVTDEDTVDILQESQDRVKAMASVYEKLYLSKDLTKIHFNNYIQSLVQGLFYSHAVHEGQITSLIEMEDIMLNIETAVPCGLIVSELVSNSLKHAFLEDKKGTITVSLKWQDGKYELKVSDNGVGFPEAVDFRKTHTLGLKLVNSLVSQIDGEITLDRTNGTEFAIIFKELKYMKRI